MSVSIFGSDPGTVTVRKGNGKWMLVCPPDENINPSKLTAYINRVNTILEDQIKSYDNDTTIKRLDVIRQEICVVTNTPFRPLVQKVTLSNGAK